MSEKEIKILILTMIGPVNVSKYVKNITIRYSMHYHNEETGELLTSS
jgi:hypothetical protein